MDFFRNGEIGGAFLGVKVAPVATLLSFDVFALIALRNASLRSKSMVVYKKQNRRRHYQR